MRSAGNSWNLYLNLSNYKLIIIAKSLKRFELKRRKQNGIKRAGKRKRKGRRGRGSAQQEPSFTEKGFPEGHQSHMALSSLTKVESVGKVKQKAAWTGTAPQKSFRSRGNETGGTWGNDQNCLSADMLDSR